MSSKDIIEWICDRCHQRRQHPRHGGMPPGWWRLMRQIMQTGRPEYTSHYMDLCSACRIDLQEFMNPELPEEH